MRRLLPLLSLLLLAGLAPVEAAPTILNGARSLATGLYYQERTVTVNGRAIPVRMLVRQSSARLRLVPAVAPKGLKHPATLKAIAQGQHAVAAINGGYFGNGGYPVGTIVIDGQVASLDTIERSAIGTLTSGQVQCAPIAAKAFVTFDDYFEPIWLWGYNQPLHREAVVLYNHFLGSTSVGMGGGRGIRLSDGQIIASPASGALSLAGVPPPIATPEPEAKGPKKVVITNADLPTRPGNRPTLPAGPLVLGFGRSDHGALKRANVGGKVFEGVVLPPVWKTATNILTAGPLILQNGKAVSQVGNPEGFRSDILGSATRSLVGVGVGGEILFIQIPVAVSIAEETEVARGVGCRSALNLDGGGSSGLWALDSDPESGQQAEVCLGCNGRQLGSALLLVEGSGVGGKTVPYFDGAIFETWRAMQG